MDNDNSQDQNTQSPPNITASPEPPMEQEPSSQGAIPSVPQQMPEPTKNKSILRLILGLALGFGILLLILGVVSGKSDTQPGETPKQTGAKNLDIPALISQLRSSVPKQTELKEFKKDATGRAIGPDPVFLGTVPGFDYQVSQNTTEKTWIEFRIDQRGSPDSLGTKEAAKAYYTKVTVAGETIKDQLLDAGYKAKTASAFQKQKGELYGNDTSTCSFDSSRGVVVVGCADNSDITKTTTAAKPVYDALKAGFKSVYTIAGISTPEIITSKTAGYSVINSLSISVFDPANPSSNAQTQSAALFQKGSTWNFFEGFIDYVPACSAYQKNADAKAAFLGQPCLNEATGDISTVQ